MGRLVAANEGKRPVSTEQATQTVTIAEIRARHDRNRLLGTYDPVRRLLRLFHRGEQVTVNIGDLDCRSILHIEPYADT